MSSVIEPRPAPQAASEESDPWRYGERWIREHGPDGTERHVRIPLKYEDLLHPQEGDRRMENPGHSRDCHYLQSCFEARLRPRSDCVSLRDCRIEWGVEGVEAHGPDISAFERVTTWNPRAGTFRVGDLGAHPLLVVEVTSPDNFRQGLVEKVREYWQARIPLYVIVDRCAGVDRDQLRLLGYRWTLAGFASVSLDENDRLPIEPLKLWLGIEGDRVVCYDEHGQRIPDAADAIVALTEEKVRADAEKARADAEAETRRAAEARADGEAETRRIAEAQVQELQAELRRLRGES